MQNILKAIYIYNVHDKGTDFVRRIGEFSKGPPPESSTSYHPLLYVLTHLTICIQLR